MLFYVKHFLLAICFTGIYCYSFSQLHPLSSNPCGVIASFTPGNDSIVAPFFHVTFTSTSQNATSYQWFINGGFNSNASSFTIGDSEPGLYEIKLVAQNGTCTDTAVCYYFCPGPQPANRDNIRSYYSLSPWGDYGNDLISTQDSGYLICGYTNVGTGPFNYINFGSLIKINQSGCIEWAKEIPSKTINGGKVNKVIQLADKNYIVYGYSDGMEYIIKLDQSGNELWSKNYNYGIDCIKPTDDGGFVFAAGSLGGIGMIIVRADGSGNVLWSKCYGKYGQYSSIYVACDLLQKGTDLYFAGMTDQETDTYGNITDVYSGILMKINDANGQTQWTKNYGQNGTALLPSDLHWYGNQILLNARGGSGVSNPNNNYSFLDNSGSVLSSYTISTPGINFLPNFNKVMPLPNGELYFLNSGTEILSLQPGYTYHSIFIKVDASQNIKWIIEYGHYSSGILPYPSLGPNGIFAALGTEYGDGLPVYSLSQKYMFQKIDSSGGLPSVACNLETTQITITPLPVSVQPFAWDTDSVIQVSTHDTLYPMNTPYGQARFVCPVPFVDSCSFLKISGKASVCNLADTYTYHVHRNRACNEPVNWDISPGVNIITKSDSMVTVQFTSFGYYKIAAVLPYSCTPVKDSVMVTVASSTIPPNLGNDTSLCPGTNIILHAGSHFQTYQWQDGTSDSTYTVNAPGKYWVIVTDSCDNILKDTINVSAASKLHINIGPDRIKCNNDTIQLNAPSGFLNYQWIPDYNISSDTAKHVVIDPSVDTSYILIASKASGCVASDTIHITVLNSPDINLGNDTSLCIGDSLVLNAGVGFVNYQWNTGENTQLISVSKTGAYIITAKTIQGCTSYDTLRIVNVFPNPVTTLNRDSILCLGTSRILDPGNFSSYLWNNGSISRTITANSLGIYSVLITDNNNCSAKDSVIINKLSPLPHDFLSADTSICLYESYLIKPLTNFENYLWSTNETSSTITVSLPGSYWLQVTDSNNCQGYDTININQKNCLEGFYIANAFTPNDDGKNDIFKPLLFGRVEKYQFSIFNRYGQIVFNSTNTSSGWDGMVSGIAQKTDTFVWICTYQFAGGNLITKKGTVILLR